MNIFNQGIKVAAVLLLVAMAGCVSDDEFRREHEARVTAEELIKTLNGRLAEQQRSEEADVAADVKVATFSEIEAEIKKLGPKPTATALASTMALVDEWVPKSGDEKKFESLKTEQLIRLRSSVKDEVTAHQEAALRAPSGASAAEEYAAAGQALSLYPMSETPIVLQEARALALRQAETVSRLEIIRRQRYNRWAVGQIEKALEYHNRNVSHVPLVSNHKLVAALVADIAVIDPAVLEPVALDVYNYVIDKTKASVNEDERFELAKGLTGPTVPRKTLAEF